MARTPLIAGNWKMNLGPGATQTFLEELLQQPFPDDVEILVCPPFVSLPVASLVLGSASVGLAAQNVHWEEGGAYTGEVSAPMLVELGVAAVIVGHSERRAMFADTDETVAKRARTAQAHGLTVIYCLGETLDEREAEATFDVLTTQSEPLSDLDPDRLVVAYEPVWAIGTGRTAAPAQAQEAHRFLRDRLRSFHGDAADAMRILYGGSVKPANALDLVSEIDVDGGLIGGASLDVASFSAIIRAAAERPS
jgi:triosephosphate isomerase